MNRQKKEQVIATLKEDFIGNQAAFLVGYKGLDVSQMSTLRHALREKGGACKVVKVTLIKRGLDQVPAVQALQPYVKEQVALVFANEEPASVAKVLKDFAKEHEALQLIAGCLEEQFLDSQAITALASLPSKEVLLGQICGTLVAPAAGLACLTTTVMRRLLFAINQVATKQAK